MSVTDPSTSLNCRAFECPYPWSVDASGHGKLCQHHAWASVLEWPRITQDLLLAIAASTGQPKPEVRRIPFAEKMDALKALRAALHRRSFAPQDGTEWARRLQARHQRGERLNGAQIACYRAALRINASEPADDDLIEDAA